MAISIDTVYQRVLALANKEQRGYITPQEFNLFADQAQNEIFEQYFYDLNQYARQSEGSEEYSNIVSNINEKIVPFEKVSNITVAGVVSANDLYRLGTVVYQGLTKVEEVQENEIHYIISSPLTQPTFDRPIYIRNNINSITTYPANLTNLTCNYIKKPTKPNWGYVVLDGKAMFDSINATNFELHPSEENELVYKMLQFAGVSIKGEYLAKAGKIFEQSQVQQEKQ